MLHNIERAIQKTIQRVYRGVPEPQSVEDPTWAKFTEVAFTRFGFIIKYFQSRNPRVVSFTKTRLLFGIEEDLNKIDILTKFEEVYLRFIDGVGGFHIVEALERELGRTVSLTDVMEWSVGVDVNTVSDELQRNIHILWEGGYPRSRGQIWDCQFNEEMNQTEMTTYQQFLFEAPHHMSTLYHVVKGERVQSLSSYMEFLVKEYLRYIADPQFKFPTVKMIAKQLGLHGNFLPELRRAESAVVDCAKKYLQTSLKTKKVIEDFGVRKTAGKKMRNRFRLAMKREKKKEKKREKRRLARRNQS